jgi:hypothetical protein
MKPTKQAILGISSAKTRKGESLGYLTGICYLSPADLSGVANVCPWAGNCKEICLNSAGRGAFNSVQKARRNKTVFYKENKEQFMLNLRRDILALERKAKRIGFTPCVRINGTSDLRVHKEPVMQEFPHVQFYDYTKDFVKMGHYLGGKLPSNYHLTFSYDGDNSNWRECLGILAHGGNVAVVFRKEIPTEWRGYKVIDGDLHDLRFLDPQGPVIVGLKAKGKAKKDRSGFVVDL